VEGDKTKGREHSVPIKTASVTILDGMEGVDSGTQGEGSGTTAGDLETTGDLEGTAGTVDAVYGKDKEANDDLGSVGTSYW
jgi:hypothetical protein